MNCKLVLHGGLLGRVFKKRRTPKKLIMGDKHLRHSKMGILETIVGAIFEKSIQSGIFYDFLDKFTVFNAFLPKITRSFHPG
jgi:hypothetical protein